MRLATFNVENMFERARALNLETWAEGKPILDDYARLSDLIEHDVYTDEIKTELIEIMKRHRGLLTKGESRYIILRDIRGRLLRKPKGKPAEIGVDGRRDWIGWFELTKEPVKEVATENTARIINLVRADVLCVVEAEDRIGLKRFSEEVIPIVDGKPYDHIMLIDGNDDRGIDVGIMTTGGFDIVRMSSHVDDLNDADDSDDKSVRIFSRDCPEFEIKTPSGSTLLVLVNHFKSKGYGDPKKSAQKRLIQATRVREIYEERLKDGYEYIAIAGDLNEVPDQWPMDPLIRNKSTLIDVMSHPDFVGDGRPGTYGNGTKSGKLDYILMSPGLSEKVVAAGIERRGVWGGVKGTLFPHLDTMHSSKDAASDHAALWIDAEL
jgi:endonuclease/exonuclease/phosphatase family metal-dependent hydrolase